MSVHLADFLFSGWLNGQLDKPLGMHDLAFELQDSLTQQLRERSLKSIP